MNNNLNKFINKYFTYLVYGYTLIFDLIILYYARENGLLPRPPAGTDQLTMLKTAVDLYHGILPPENYLYTFSYNIYIFIIMLIAQGNLVVMRILQAATCALIPVFIYKTSRRLRVGRLYSQIAACIYCFYGVTALISLSFLRASPLALCFLLTIYFILKAYTSKKTWIYFVAGIFAGLTILGRENFIPVVMIPLAALFFRQFRIHIGVKKTFAYLMGIFSTIFPFILYNYVRFNRIAIIPGHFNNVLLFIHKKEVKVNLNDSDFLCILEKAPAVLWQFFSNYELPNSLSFYAHREIIDSLWILIIPFNLILGFAILGAVMNYRQKHIQLLSTVTVCYVGTLLIFAMFYRYRIPIFPILCILAAIGLKSLIKIKTTKMKFFITLMIILFFIITYTSPNKLRTISERKAVIKILIDNKRFIKAKKLIFQLEKENKTNTVYLKRHFIQEQTKQR